jgi:hypothetical protein
VIGFQRSGKAKKQKADSRKPQAASRKLIAES